ncbi:hypothetical protein AB0G74_03705 [Streptomyces sp. NPDC020875]|uniref:hypothetical protein n=1 Tax=Streptomyces sp. NPDC020875 TaxID=3154898 RepID=UPI0033FD46A3
MTPPDRPADQPSGPPPERPYGSGPGTGESSSGPGEPGRPAEDGHGPGAGAAGPQDGYHPGSAEPRLNRAVRERYPQIRSTSGWTDPRIRHTGPGPGAGGEQDPAGSAGLTARLVLVLGAVAGQLWGLTVVVDAWMSGRTETAWWGAGFLCLSFVVVLGLWALGPKDR